MIKFFREIRQNLIIENKSTKYFKYAVGEIILILVDILIAAQINNWNEHKKRNQEETTILKSLHENLILAKYQSEALIIRERGIKKILINVLGIQLNINKVNITSITDSIFTVDLEYSNWYACN